MFRKSHNWNESFFLIDKELTTTVEEIFFLLFFPQRVLLTHSVSNLKTENFHLKRIAERKKG